jgi:hypothetical protein
MAYNRSKFIFKDDLSKFLDGKNELIYLGFGLELHSLSEKLVFNEKKLLLYILKCKSFRYQISTSLG